MLSPRYGHMCLLNWEICRLETPVKFLKQVAPISRCFSLLVFPCSPLVVHPFHVSPWLVTLPHLLSFWSPLVYPLFSPWLVTHLLSLRLLLVPPWLVGHPTFGSPLVGHPSPFPLPCISPTLTFTFLLVGHPFTFLAVAPCLSLGWLPTNGWSPNFCYPLGPLPLSLSCWLSLH